MDLQALIGEHLGLDSLSAGGVKDLITAKLAEGAQNPDEIARFITEKTGIDEAKLQSLIPMLGDSGMLGGLLGKLDADGDGSVIDDAAGLLGGFFK